MRINKKLWSIFKNQTIIFVFSVVCTSIVESKHFLIRTRAISTHDDGLLSDFDVTSSPFSAKLRTSWANQLGKVLKLHYENLHDKNPQHVVGGREHRQQNNEKEFITRQIKSDKKFKVHLHRKYQGSTFRHHFPVAPVGLPAYYDTFKNYHDDEEEEEAEFQEEAEDPHSHQERYKSSDNSKEHEEESDEENKEAKEKPKHSLSNSYFDNEYSLSMLHRMECVTPTNSRGYCSTFRACVPSLFNPEGELEAPALAELVSMSIGYCSPAATSTTSGTPPHAHVNDNHISKRKGQIYTAVASRIICCPGSPGISSEETYAEKFKDFLAGASGDDEVGGPQSHHDGIKQTGSSVHEAAELDQNGNKNGYVQVEADTDAEIWHSEEDVKAEKNKKPSNVIPIEVLLPQEVLASIEKHEEPNDGNSSEKIETDQQPIRPVLSEYNESPPPPPPPISNEGGIKDNNDEAEDLLEFHHEQGGGEAVAVLEKDVDNSSLESTSPISGVATEPSKIEISGENSTFLKISPEPVIGANGKFTLENGVIVEKITVAQPPQYLSNQGVFKDDNETTVESQVLILKYHNGQKVDQGGGEILLPTTSTTTIPEIIPTNPYLQNHQENQEYEAEKYATESPSLVHLKEANAVQVLQSNEDSQEVEIKTTTTSPSDWLTSEEQSKEHDFETNTIVPSPSIPNLTIISGNELLEHDGVDEEATTTTATTHAAVDTLEEEYPESSNPTNTAYPSNLQETEHSFVTGNSLEGGDHQTATSTSTLRPETSGGGGGSRVYEQLEEKETSFPKIEEKEEGSTLPKNNKTKIQYNKDSAAIIPPAPSQTETETGGISPVLVGEEQFDLDLASACSYHNYFYRLLEEGSKRFPYLATIVGGSRPFCSGTLITERHILTASHFLSNITVSDVFRMRVHVGYRIHPDGTTMGPYAVRKVLKVVRHKGFSFDKLVNDIAILLLDEPIRFSEHIHPVCLTQGVVAAEHYGTVAFETGWAEKPMRNPIDSHIFNDFSFGYKNVTWELQESKAILRSTEECSSNYQFLKKSGVAITESMLCAGTIDGKSCNLKGNSGAPLFIQRNKSSIQIGVVSWGIGCGHFPAVFTNVSKYIPWIKKVIHRTR